MLSVFDQAKHYTSELWAIKSHFRIEAAALFFFLPGFLMIIGMSVFELEKACRVNLRLESQICDNLNNIPYKEMCSSLENHESLFSSKNGSENGLNELLKIVHTKGYHVEGLSELVIIHKVCKAEKESQKLMSQMFAIGSPIGNTLKIRWSNISRSLSCFHSYCLYLGNCTVCRKLE